MMVVVYDAIAMYFALIDRSLVSACCFTLISSLFIGKTCVWAWLLILIARTFTLCSVLEKPQEEVLASEEILSIVCNTPFSAEHNRSALSSSSLANHPISISASTSPSHQQQQQHQQQQTNLQPAFFADDLVPPLATPSNGSFAASAYATAASFNTVFTDLDSLRCDSPLSFLLPCTSPPLSPHAAYEEFDEFETPPTRAHNPLPLNSPFEHDESQASALEFLAFSHSSYSSPFLKFSPLVGKGHRVRSRSMGDSPAMLHPAYTSIAQRRAEDNHHVPYCSSQLAATHVS
jgi:hypothetical protein